MNLRTLPALTAAAVVVALSATSARAEGPGRPPQGQAPRPQRSASQTPAQGLGPSSGLQTGQLQPSTSFAARLSDEDWRKLFAKKDAAN